MSKIHKDTLKEFDEFINTTHLGFTDCGGEGEVKYIKKFISTHFTDNRILEELLKETEITAEQVVIKLQSLLKDNRKEIAKKISKDFGSSLKRLSKT